MNTIFKKIPAIMAEVGAIEKTRRNQSQNYQFRGIDDVYSAMQPLLAKHGVFYAPNVLREMREERTGKSGGTLIYTVLTVEFTFFADDGSSFKASTVGEAMDSGDKSANKAMSAALKYALLQVFCIPTEGDHDTENHSPEPLPRSQPAPRPTPQPAATSADPGAYVMRMGKAFKGKRLDACDIYELNSFAKWLGDQPEISGLAEETLREIEAFLVTRDKGRAK